MSALRGQALVEYTAVLAALVAALCLPLAGDLSLVEQLEGAIRHFWHAWRAALLAVEYATWR